MTEKDVGIGVEIVLKKTLFFANKFNEDADPITGENGKTLLAGLIFKVLDFDDMGVQVKVDGDFYYWLAYEDIGELTTIDIIRKRLKICKDI